jgi:DNA-binding NarL/FixJ family response regulator
MKFLVVDDHPLMRRGARQLLEEAFAGAQVLEADSAEVALDHLAREPVELVLLDLSLPGMSGLEALERIKRLQPDARVLILTMHGEEQFALSAFKLGAAGYVTKEHATSELLEAARRILLGGRYIPSRLAEALVAQATGDGGGPPHARLSPRELRVMCLIAAGKTVSQIADEMFLSVKTVSTYRARLLEKMSMETNADLTRYCVQNGLVE